MKKSVMAGVFGAGLAVVGWVAWGFVGSSPLALAIDLDDNGAEPPTAPNAAPDQPATDT